MAQNKPACPRCGGRWGMDITCPNCTNPDGTSKPEPTEETPEFLQVFLTHDAVIQAFQIWVAEQGWELKLMPRFDSNDDTYVPTHMITPRNLDQIMAERAAQYRKDHPNEH